MRAWWRDNRTALLAVAVLIPVTAGVLGGWEWWKAAQAGRPTFAVTAEPGETVELAGATFGPGAAEEIAVPGEDLPTGTKVIAVEIPVDRHGAATSCSIPVLRELSGSERVFEADHSALDWDYRRQVLCPTDRDSDSFPDGPFSLEVPYLVPADVTGPLAVDLTVADELPRFVRVVVVP